jgi:hypothetical protein
MDFVRARLSAQPIRSELDRLIQNNQSLAGKRHEEVFTREFLCPIIAEYFYKEIRATLNLTDDEIAKGLGTEGFKNCPGFGFAPARKLPHLFTKSDIVKSTPPQGWITGAIPMYQACPDFAITRPLPVCVVGEVKYFKAGSQNKAIKELYNGARQAVFYLGSFIGEYRGVLLVVADASPDHAFVNALSGLQQDLLNRFGESTSVYLLDLILT